jgi:hypothetical protein
VSVGLEVGWITKQVLSFTFSFMVTLTSELAKRVIFEEERGRLIIDATS